MSKESFKSFVSRNPNLSSFVNSGEMTWQKFYEMYDLYGENSNVWDKYTNSSNREVKSTSGSTLLGDTSLKEIFNTLKKVDLETVRKGVDGISKAVNLLQDLSSNKTNNSSNNYQRRPMYQYFED